MQRFKIDLHLFANPCYEISVPISVAIAINYIVQKG